MRTMPSKIHGCLDYAIALISILSPVLFGFGEGNSETLLPIAFGMLIILYSFFTDYETGLSKQIPFYLHVRMDQIAGALLATSPWLFRFYEEVYLPHVILGMMLIVSSLLAGNDLPALFNAIRHRSWNILELLADKPKNY
jgi:hypothetical protein